MTTEQNIAELTDRLEDLLSEQAISEAVELLASIHPADQADLYLQLSAEKRDVLLSLFSAEGMARLLEHLDEDDRAEIIEKMPRASLARVLDHMGNDEAADVLQQLSPADAARVLTNMRTATEVTPLLEHKETSAGGLMTRGYVALHQEMTVQQAITYLKLRKPFAEESYYLYVLDNANRLQGVVNLRELVVADSDTTIEQIMVKDVITVMPGTDQEECARTLQRYRLRALPVVDEEGVLKGVITADDLMEVVTEEATEDIYHLAGLGADESVLSPLGPSLRRRIPWLVINLVTAFVAAMTVRAFEDTISKVALLAVFMPLVAGHGGNTGSQVATLMVRGLALGEVGPQDGARIIAKQIAFNIVHGAVVGTLTALLAFALSSNWWLAGVVFVAMVGNVLIAGMAGALIPLGLKAIKVDPALASTIWLTTFTDVMGFLMLLGGGALLTSKLS
ncbi:MAG TPA: magnesium transporter [Dehalococcoidia bacterium]|nr:magnesium transporter [Dehalococcoidia bacterium]